jgi:hypothetical protein
MLKQNPFSLYDFLGYFIPGALLSYLIVSINYIESITTSFVLNDLINNTIKVQFNKVFFFIIISYAIGHLINFISSTTIEQYANWKYNYPSKYLLGYNYKGMWNIKKPSSYLWRITLLILVFPITILDFLIGNVFGFNKFYTKKLDDFLIDLITSKGESLMNTLINKELKKKYKDIQLRDYDFHRIISHYTFETSKNHQFRMINYVVLYGFLRSMTLITIISIWYIIINHFEKLTENKIITVLLILSTIAYIFFMAFMKFYRRYTLEAFMIISIDENL